ncbi:Cyclin-dependent kinase G-2 [Camellia lanceoleosa]|uniref:Cyclin-dependent kinase G-2 n=1 Tax=Camellia lanceoleosa TaxID=1840588 RepID=A0ACC0J1R5_9ERIC|nr:Cyclin-dependent kinase G-2 [Camellia lanceoleosa]
MNKARPVYNVEALRKEGNVCIGVGIVVDETKFVAGGRSGQREARHFLGMYNLLRRKFPATSFTGSPVLSDAGFDLLNQLLTYDPEKRITAEDALKHEWFREVPLPKSKEFMPTFPNFNMHKTV